MFGMYTFSMKINIITIGCQACPNICIWCSMLIAQLTSPSQINTSNASIIQSVFSPFTIIFHSRASVDRANRSPLTPPTLSFNIIVLIVSELWKSRVKISKSTKCGIRRYLNSKTNSSRERRRLWKFWISSKIHPRRLEPEDVSRIEKSREISTRRKLFS